MFSPRGWSKHLFSVEEANLCQSPNLPRDLYVFFAPFRMSLFLTYVLGKTSPIPMGLFLDKASGRYNPLQALASSIFCNILFSGTKLALQRD